MSDCFGNHDCKYSEQKIMNTNLYSIATNKDLKDTIQQKQTDRLSPIISNKLSRGIFHA